ncbi:helix-turn-helix transcriptional regulator [Saccharopolyspora indica]|uniref:winged helix-turn-helix transcriptional regulator n=1 Tax=Saccharopolyspora indica TaxID=1229659 RepID=UPI0022EB4382|nr:helix-turn-helix domain-containing protein [Saccharopolyspora indica]MDA3645143.1 helix-turn-helix domain-containing protein [Saccharopolyspora indica]
MGLGRDYTGQDCSLARALEVVGERWTLLVLRDCFYGVRHFRDFQAHLDIPRAVLTARLKTLVSEGLLERHPHGTEVHYLLTERGIELWPTVYTLARWGERWFSPGGARRIFSHATCGTDLTATGSCPACDTTPAPADITARQGPGADPTLRDDPVSEALRRGPHRLLTALNPEPAYRAPDS